MVSQQFTDKRKQRIHTTLTTPTCQTVYNILQELTTPHNTTDWVSKQTITKHVTIPTSDVTNALQKLQAPGLIERRYTTTTTTAANTEKTIPVFRIANTPRKYSTTITNALNAP